MSDPVAIVGAGAVSAFGIGWRGLGRAVAAGHVQPRESVLLRESHPGTLASEVPEIPAALEHRYTHRDVAGFVHRGRQGIDAARAAVPRALALR